MGLLDYFDPDTLRGKLKGLLGGMPISQIARGEADVSREGLRAALMGIPVFDPKSGAQDAFNAGLGALTFAGVGAKTADKAALARAQKMAESGADRGAIWNETGWFKGPDNKWRFEISDKGFDFDRSGATVGPRGGGGEAGRVLPHQELYAAYPDASKITAILDFPESGFSGRMGGSYYPQQDAFSVTAPQHLAPSVAIHELQHAIQKREGFAKGGDADAIWRDMKASAREYQDHLDALGLSQMKDEYIKEFGKIPSVKELGGYYKKFWGKPIENADAYQLAYNMDEPSLRRAVDSYAEKFGGKLPGEISRLGATKQYAKLAGEAEARATQARMDFDAAKRKQIPPWESYDIPWDQLIVRY